MFRPPMLQVTIDRANPGETPNRPAFTPNWQARYPFHMLYPGDSFWLSEFDAEPRRVRAAAANYATRHNIKLQCKSEGKGITVKRIY